MEPLTVVTMADIRSWAPCYDPARYLPEDWSGTALDMLNIEAIPPQDRLWAVLRPAMLDSRTLQLCVCAIVRQTPLSDGRTVWDLLTDERSRHAIEVAEAFANGQATEEERDAARAAAWDAARDAAWDVARAAAWDAARAAAWDAARAAAWAAARDAAWDAAWAARAAAWDARDAAWDARDAQISIVRAAITAAKEGERQGLLHRQRQTTLARAAASKLLNLKALAQAAMQY